MSQSSGGGLTSGIVELLRRPIDSADRQRAALHILDWAGCAAAGSSTVPGQAMLAYARGLPPGRSHVFGGLTLTARDAALVGGSFGNVLEMDDVHRSALVHPGPVVIPTVLALAEALDTSTDQVLDAVIRGFEAMIRVGRSVGRAHYRQFHNTATCGVFGSAVAAGLLLGLDDRQMVDALGNAGTLAAGLWQCRIEDTMSKQLHNGHAAQSGLIAAELAANGFTGARFILEGPFGFYAGLCPDAESERLLAEPEAPWLIHATSFKPWPACRHTHPTIDAVLALRPLVDPSSIRRISVETYRDAVAVCDNPMPTTPVAAKFSLQHSSAVVLLRGRPALADFDISGIVDPVVAALRAQVELREEPDYTSAYPAHFGASVAITCHDGRVVRADVPDALGDPENPLTELAIRDKAKMLLTSAGYSDDGIARVVDATLALAEGAPVTGLTHLFR